MRELSWIENININKNLIVIKFIIEIIDECDHYKDINKNLSLSSL